MANIVFYSQNKIGTLTDLTTSEQGTLVGAVNEIDEDIGTLSNLTTTDKTTLVNAINELDTRTTTLETSVAGLTWTLAGTATGGTTVTYPSTATELYVAVYCNGQVHTAYVIPSVSSGAKLLVGGYYYGSSDYGLVNCDWSASNHTLNLRNAIYAGTDYKASSTLYVYYR